MCKMVSYYNSIIITKEEIPKQSKMQNEIASLRSQRQNE